MSTSATLKAARKAVRKPAKKIAVKAPRALAHGNPHPAGRDCNKVIFRVSDTVWKATEKWVRRDGFNGIATAGRVAIIRVLRAEGFLTKDQH